MAESTLKSTYSLHLGGFVIFNVLVFWVVVVSAGDLGDIKELMTTISWQDGVFGVITPVLVIVGNGLIEPTNKARLVFWRLHHPLPGSNAFTVHIKANSDGRIDADALESRWGDFPTDPAAQNKLWYKMYSEVEADARVRDGHRNWLFTRDLTAYSFLFLVAFGLSAAISATPNAAVYAMFLVVQFLIIMIAARTYGHRFVKTALAVQSHKSTDA